MSALDLLAGAFGAAGNAGGVVAYTLVAGAVVAGALRERGLAEVAVLWGLGFVAAHVVLGALGGVLELSVFGVLAAMTAAGVGVALRQRAAGPPAERDVDERWIAGGVVALWALCALHATVVAGDETLVRVLVWCSSAAVLATLALRAHEAWAQLEPATAAAPQRAATGRPGAGAAAAGPGPGPEPEPLEPSTHLWSVDGYREATRPSAR